MTHRIDYQIFADVGDRFGPRAFEGQIGEQIGVILSDGAVGEATISDAVVAEGGLAVTLTLELPEGITHFRAIQAPMPT